MKGQGEKETYHKTKTYFWPDVIYKVELFMVFQIESLWPNMAARTKV